MVDALAWPADTAGWLTECPVGPDAVAAFAVIDPARVPHAARVDLLVAAGRLQAWLAACEQRILATLQPEDTHSPMGELEAGCTRAEVAAAMRLATSTAATRLEVAAALAPTAALAATGEALAAGRISYLQAAALVEETVVLEPSDRREVETRVLARAERLTVGQLRTAARREVKRLGPCDDELRHRRAVRERRVTYRPGEDGMGEIWALLPADDAQALMELLNAMAERDRQVPGPDGQPRTFDQCRADALARLARIGLTDPDLPTRQGARPAINVTVALSTLLSCDQQPGQLDGYGPIPASMARRIAADPSGTWRRLIVDEWGRLLDYGRTTYRPPADLRDFVVGRDRQCVFPGCTRQAREADLDHHLDWDYGGQTEPQNLGPLCPYHHRIKHEAGWVVTRWPNGYVLWRSPAGRTYVRDPEPYPVDDWRWDGGDPPDRPDPPPPPGPGVGPSGGGGAEAPPF